MTYTTKTTRIGSQYGCRVFINGELIVEGRAQGRLEIGPVYRDLIRTMDKLGGDAFTSASRKRKYKDGNLTANVKHIWHRGTR